MGNARREARFAADGGLLGAFSSLVARRPSAPVVVSPHRRATFGEIDSLSRAVNERVLTVAPEPGALVGLAAQNGPAFLAGFMALHRAGQSVLLLDPLAPQEDRRRIVTALGAAAVLECVPAWPSSATDFRLAGTVAAASSRVLPGIAAVKMTSGSTGAPRGVAVRVAQLLADEEALNRTMGLRDDDRLWATMPFSHSYGFTTLALSALVRGLTLLIPADRGRPFSSLAAARDLGATVYPTVPAFIQPLLRLVAPPAWPGDIRLVISAGALLSSATARDFRHTFGQPVHTFYGSSECGGICFDREGGAAERGTVGTPVDGVRLSLLPLEQPSAEEGLVVVESRSVGETYLPEPDPRLGSGHFETSDVGAWQGGELALRRRVDRAINVRGRKVDPSEVEMVLLALDGVEDAVVIGMASPDGRGAIVHAVLASRAVRPTYRDVAAWCRSRLAAYKVPSSVAFVDAIPRTSRGKVDRSALLARHPSEHDPAETHD